MQRATDALIRRLAPGEIDPSDQRTRAKIGYLEAWVSIVSNVLLGAAKLGFGLALNSISLLADAVHTGSDVVTSVVVLLGFRTASLPADEEHPYGHARMESIATVVIAVLLVVVAVEFAANSVQRLFSGEVVQGSLPVALLLVAGGAFKEWLARFSEQLGRRIDSPTLVADAWHHRSDAIASVMVAVALVASRYGYPNVDAALGVVVSGLIGYTGWDLGRSAASVLLGKRADQQTVDRITSAAAAIEGVCGVHGVALHDYGAGKSIVSLHIEVDEALLVAESHDIAEQVEAALQQELRLEATVHVEPLDAPARVRDVRPRAR